MTHEGKAYTLPSKAWLAELAAIADIRPDSLHPDHAEYFYIEVVSLLKERWRNAGRRTPNPAVLDAQKKIIAAHHAVHKLSEREREYVAQSIIASSPPHARLAAEYWELMLWGMGAALVEMTGKDPGPPYHARGRGRGKHTVANLPFHQLIESLLDLVARAHVRHLPPSWGTLSELAVIANQGCDLEAAIESGAIHPRMARKDVKALLPPPQRDDDLEEPDDTVEEPDDTVEEPDDRRDHSHDCPCPMCHVDHMPAAEEADEPATNPLAVAWRRASGEERSAPGDRQGVDGASPSR
jgi:hypothetical protein